MAHCQRGLHRFPAAALLLPVLAALPCVAGVKGTAASIALGTADSVEPKSSDEMKKACQVDHNLEEEAVVNQLRECTLALEGFAKTVEQGKEQSKEAIQTYMEAYQETMNLLGKLKDVRHIRKSFSEDQLAAYAYLLKLTTNARTEVAKIKEGMVEVGKQEEGELGEHDAGTLPTEGETKEDEDAEHEEHAVQEQTEHAEHAEHDILDGVDDAEQKVNGSVLEEDTGKEQKAAKRLAALAKQSQEEESHELAESLKLNS